MFGIDPEISALPVTIAGENMIRLVNCRMTVPRDSQAGRRMLQP